MSGSFDPAVDIDPAIVLEAADWLVLLQSGAATEDDLRRLTHWCERSAAHAAAWERAQQLLDSLQKVPSRLGHDTLLRKQGARRRQFVGLGLAAMVAPAAWLAWQAHSPAADVATGVGEIKEVALPDGSLLVLNTASAVQIVFSEQVRKLVLLRGELRITTSHQHELASARPFFVQTEHGSMQALGTQFGVRLTAHETRLMVQEGGVSVRVASAPQEMAATIVRAGEQMYFNAQAVYALQALDAGALLWQRGMFLARDLRVDALLVELARYHHTALFCDPEAGSLRVSGAFPVKDLPACLDMLEKTLPVRADQLLGYWVFVRRLRSV